MFCIYSTFAASYPYLTVCMCTVCVYCVCVLCVYCRQVVSLLESLPSGYSPHPNLIITDVAYSTQRSAKPFIHNDCVIIILDNLTLFKLKPSDSFKTIRTDLQSQTVLQPTIWLLFALLLHTLQGRVCVRDVRWGCVCETVCPHLRRHESAGVSTRTLR